MRKIIETKEFTDKGTFQALYKAQSFVTEKGYSYGSSDCSKKIAVKKGEYNLPQKLKNFTSEGIKQIDGLIYGELREGPIKVDLYEPIKKEYPCNNCQGGGCPVCSGSGVITF